MLPDEMRNAVEAVTGMAKLIGSRGQGPRSMIQVVMLSNVLARLRGAREKKLGTVDGGDWKGKTLNRRVGEMICRYEFCILRFSLN